MKKYILFFIICFSLFLFMFGKKELIKNNSYGDGMDDYYYWNDLDIRNEFLENDDIFFNGVDVDAYKISLCNIYDLSYRQCIRYLSYAKNANRDDKNNDKKPADNDIDMFGLIN